MLALPRRCESSVRNIKDPLLWRRGGSSNENKQYDEQNTGVEITRQVRDFRSIPDMVYLSAGIVATLHIK
jgi:hypothetical protein